MSLSRNPWHIREYTIREMTDLLTDFFLTQRLWVCLEMKKL